MGRVRGEVRDNWEQRRGAVPRGRREASLDEGGAATWSPKAGPPCLSFQGKPCAFNPRVGVRQKRAASCGFRSELGALGGMNQRWDCLPLGRRFPALHSPVCTPLWWPFWALCKPGVSLARRSRSVLPPGDTRGSRGGRRRAAGTCCCDSRALPRGHAPAVPLCPAAAGGLNVHPLPVFPGAASPVCAPLWVAERTRAGGLAVFRWLQPQMPDPRADGPSVHPRFSAFTACDSPAGTGNSQRPDRPWPRTRLRADSLPNGGAKRHILRESGSSVSYTVEHTPANRPVCNIGPNPDPI